jgi:hypothetical protein
MINGLLQSVFPVQISGKNLPRAAMATPPGSSQVIPVWRGFQRFLLRAFVPFVVQGFAFPITRDVGDHGDLLQPYLLFNLGDLWQYPAIMPISSTPPPTPYVHPIPPKVTQSTQESAEGRKPKMMRGEYIALVFPITRSPDVLISTTSQPSADGS